MSSLLRLVVPALLVLVAAPVTAQSVASRAAGIPAGEEAGARASSLLVQPARLRVEHVPLPAGLEELHRKSGVALAFSPSLLPADLLVTCECERLTVGEALEKLLAGTSFRYSELGSQVVIEPKPPQHPLRVLPPPSSAPVFASYVPQPARPARPPAALPAAQTGTITGQVVEARAQRPLSGAQVHIPGTGLGTLTNNAGRFMLVNVPAGAATVQVRMIGYGTAEQTATVAAGETVTLNFELAQEALALDEVLVTGTAGQARRREVGNTIGQINMARVDEPVLNVDNILQARVAGLSVMRSSGMAGSGGQIRLRGNVSVAMSNQPLVYVDGVRIRSDGYPRNVSPAGHQGRSNNDVASPLNDINPADIERIEVIKGAAATTLYGTEAAAGVIQIFTKRGATGRAVWTAQVNQGLSRLQPFAPPEAPYLYLDPWLKTAHTQGYALSVSGGGQDLRYFVSGGYDDNEGVLPNDWEKKYLVRGNFAFSPSSTVALEWNTSYTNNTISNTPAGNNSHGLMLNAFRGDQNFFGDRSPEVISQVLDYEIFSYIDRLITGMTANFSPTANLSNRVTVGYDLAMNEMRQLRPFGFVFAPEGILSDIRWSNTTLTFDYVGNFDFGLSSELRSRFSWGGQAVSTEEISLAGYAEDFPGPGVPTLSSGSRALAFEDRIRVVNAGVFVQNLFSLRDRYFLTIGTRVDGNSAFGENLGLQLYPKVSASYVISDESFWGEEWGTLKLRAAYGHSGRAPGAFDAVRTWNPVGWGGQPAFRPGNVGNPDLGPERTAETEFGFDAALFGGRLSLDFTSYHQKTTDALFAVRQVPSMGIGSSQLANVGALENRGIEIAATGILIDQADWGLELGLNLSTNHSKVLSLGDAPPFSLGSFGWIVEGQPVPVIRGQRIMNPHDLADPVIEQDHFYGPNQPTHIVSPRIALRLPANIQLSARGEYQGGHFMYEAGSFNSLVRAVEWPTCTRAYQMLEAGRSEQLTNIERARCVTANVRQDWFIYPADFFRLRDVSMTLPIGAVVPRASRASLTLSARDFWLWKNSEFPIFDPEVGSNEGMNAQVRQIGEHIPPPSVFTASLRVVF